MNQKVEFMIALGMVLLTAYWIQQSAPILTVIAATGALVWFFDYWTSVVDSA